MDKNSSPVEPHILTLQELYDAASRMLRIKKMRKDTPIMITTADRSIGGRAFVYAAWIGEGSTGKATRSGSLLMKKS